MLVNEVVIVALAFARSGAGADDAELKFDSVEEIGVALSKSHGDVENAGVGMVIRGRDL